MNADQDPKWLRHRVTEAGVLRRGRMGQKELHKSWQNDATYPRTSWVHRCGRCRKASQARGKAAHQTATMCQLKMSTEAQLRSENLPELRLLLDCSSPRGSLDIIPAVTPLQRAAATAVSRSSVPTCVRKTHSLSVYNRAGFKDWCVHILVTQHSRWLPAIACASSP